MSDSPGKCKNTVTTKEILDILSQRLGSWEQENVVFFSRRRSVIVKVIDNDGGAVWREVNVELEEERDDCAWCTRIGGKPKEDITPSVGEFEENFRG